jgi:hypothetical protein
LSIDGRHIELTSKDLEQIENFRNILCISNKIASKSSGFSNAHYYRIQFGNIRLYEWMKSIGLHPQKTKTIGQIALPDEFFFDFLRGHLDGDEYTYFYYDSRWQSSFLFYTNFISASESHVLWIQDTIKRLLGISGKVSYSNSTYRVRYAKIDSLKLMDAIYYSESLICLTRKRDKIKKALQICRGGEMVDTLV